MQPGTMSTVSVAAMVLGFVAATIALLQGVAWLGARRGRPRALAGAALAIAGMLALIGALLTGLVPGFWS